MDSSRQFEPHRGSPSHFNDIVLPKQTVLRYPVKLQAGQAGKYPPEEPGWLSPATAGINREDLASAVAPARLIAPGRPPPRSSIVTGEVPRQPAGPRQAAAAAVGTGRTEGPAAIGTGGGRAAGKRGGREITKL